VFRHFRLWSVDIKEQKCLGEGNKNSMRTAVQTSAVTNLAHLTSARTTAQVHFFRPMPPEGRGLAPKSRGLRGCWRGCGRISCSAFKGLTVLLLAINAHGLNGLRSKALLSRQRSIKLLPETPFTAFCSAPTTPHFVPGWPLWSAPLETASASGVR
jgi:hypothetical protein